MHLILKILEKGQDRAYSKNHSTSKLSNYVKCCILEVFLAVYNSKQHRQKHFRCMKNTKRGGSFELTKISQEIEKQCQDRSNSTVPIMTLD